MRSKKGHKPPSRERYEDSHPTISVRVSRELYDQIREIREATGKSIGELLRESLGVQKRTTASAYNRGYDKGYAEARERFRVTYPCSRCGKVVELQGAEAKKAAAQYMEDHGWHHSDCQ